MLYNVWFCLFVGLFWKTYSLARSVFEKTPPNKQSIYAKCVVFEWSRPNGAPFEGWIGSWTCLHLQGQQSGIIPLDCFLQTSIGAALAFRGSSSSISFGKCCHLTRNMLPVHASHNTAPLSRRPFGTSTRHGLVTGWHRMNMTLKYLS